MRQDDLIGGGNSRLPLFFFVEGYLYEESYMANKGHASVN